VRGLPGSGKSYLVRELHKILGDETVVLDPDATDNQSKQYRDHVEDSNTNGVDPKLHAYRFLRAQAYQGIAENKIIIWNQPFTNLDIFNKMVANLHKHAAEHELSLTVFVVEVQIDTDVARQRIMKRKSEGGHGPSDATFKRFGEDYRSFAPDGYDTVTVNGQDSVQDSANTVLQALQGLLSHPELRS